MKREISIFQSKLFGNKLLRIAKRQICRIPLVIYFNIFTVVFLSILSVYAKLESKGAGIDRLFSDPFDNAVPYVGWLTGISEILWCITIGICLFTFTLISQARYRSKSFLLASTIVMSLLFFDDRFRLTLMICAIFKGYIVVKALVYSVYGAILILYGIKFRKQIAKTPYLLLIVSFFLFIISSLADLSPITSVGVHAMLEDGTKLIGLINLTLYFWYVCRIELQKSIILDR